MDSLPGAVFDGVQRLYVTFWLDAGDGFKKFNRIPLSRAPRAISCLRLGNLPAEKYLTTTSVIPIGNSNFSERISSSNLEAFTNNNNVFTIGDGLDNDYKRIEADTAQAAGTSVDGLKDIRRCIERALATDRNVTAVRKQHAFVEIDEPRRVLCFV